LKGIGSASRWPSEAAPTHGRYLWLGDGGLKEAEFARITRSTLFAHFDVTWPQGGKLGTLTGVLCPCGVQLILFLSNLVPESCQKRSYLSCLLLVLFLAVGVCDPGSVNQRIRLPSLIRVREAVRPTLTLLSSLPSYPRPFCVSAHCLYFCLLLRVMVSLHLACTSFPELTLLSIGDVKHTVLQIRLRRSLHRDSLFASRRKVSMGAHLYRRTRRRHTATDAKTAFEADISS
jgi:hypothetical protein